MDYRLDEIDRRIIYELMCDARNTSAPTIAEQVNVSPGTVRNRIRQLEEHGIIRGYTVGVDFERADGHLTNLYICNAPISERKPLAREASAVPGVINVRELMTGRRNLHILAVGEDTAALRRITRALSRLGIEIEDETLVEAETNSPYRSFGPDDDVPTTQATDFISLTGDANVVDVTVKADAPIVGKTLAEAVRDETLDDDSLVIAIERDDRVLTPHGTTTIEPDDIVTVLSRSGDTDRILKAFVSSDERDVSTPDSEDAERR
ncbi:DNA-binding transcriptional regulator, Lrp family [Halogranum amylolyticum]|uniref:DNA-binding transcriptional regulator, Lrp family n=1 Tax=Halogranum amylolyticum TaxID=660520 RepID=A0A1H8PC00_9EURY|nr:Lrp/AsnC family transcriptional regulator [Halogranum amylolyticum]SEO39455.1 DNA-binding transcriptional regulator, Lrp family [Halogranum amylolyticum]